MTLGNPTGARLTTSLCWVSCLNPTYDSLDELLAGETEERGEEIYWGKPEGEELW
ncbi:MAG: hypothetical protein GDA56_00505 [Hormoscilla sp. GM7CHS1pb]|nr:hypothetical protein [Hormoscilla sp. GM7CHS1pb]